MDGDQINAYVSINCVVNIISIFFSSLLVFIISVLRSKQINTSNRISVRFIMYISIREIIFSIFQILRITPDLPQWISYGSSLGYIFTTLLNCFLIATVLINVQLRYIHNYKGVIHVKWFYLAIPISVVIILSGLTITFEHFNFDQNRLYFWYSTKIMEWFAYQGWIAFIVLYCIVLFTFIKYRLSKNPQEKVDIQILTDATDSTFSATSTMVSTSNPILPVQPKLLSKYVSHIILYSLIPIIAYLPSMIAYFINLRTKDDNFYLNLFTLIFISSQGLSTFIIFMFDPIIDEAICECERNWKVKQKVCDKVKKGVYVNNIYSIDLELPSSKAPKQNSDRQSKYSSAIYVCAKNAKNRISGLTSILSNRKKSMDIRKELFNIENVKTELSNAENVKKDLFNVDNVKKDLFNVDNFKKELFNVYNEDDDIIYLL